MSLPGRNSLTRFQNIKKEPGITIKTEPGTLDLERLSSFKRPRDLSLGGTPHKTKKIFTPNVNIVRNKSKNADVATPSTSTNRPPRTSNRGEESRTRGRGRGRGNPPNLIQTWGVFSEGIGSTVRKPSAPSESAGPSLSHNVTRTSKNERQKIKRELEVDDEKEKLSLQKLFEDHDLDFAEYEPDYMFAPEELPFNKETTKTFEKKIKEEIEDSPACEKAFVKLEDVKEEKLETLDSFFKSHDQKLILFQMPDTLPGFGKSTESEQNASTSSTPTSENISRCTLNDIDEGVVGKIVIYRSGKSKLLMGNMEFSVELGLQSTCLQSVMSIDADPDKTGDMIDLGPIEGTLIVTPDWNYLDNKQ